MPAVTHTPIGGSSMERTIGCTASVPFCADMPRRDSAASRTGTAGHAVLELAVTDPNLNLWEISHVKLHDGTMYDVDMEMRTCVQDAVQRIRAIAAELEAPIQSEVGFDLGKMLPEDLRDVQVRGTADIVIYQPFGQLVVIDFKYGVGVPVDAKGNAQLRTYAVGALTTCLGKPETIRICIFQPRSAHGAAWSEETITLEELMTWWNTVAVPAIREAEGPSPKFRSGPHCKFCPGAGQCKEIAKAACESAGLVFAGTAPLAKADIKITPPEKCTDEQLRRCLDAAELISTWCDAAKEEVARRLEAGTTNENRIGYKFVAGKSNRSWKDETVVRKELALMGSAIFEPQTLLSPAQMEKLIKQSKGDVKILEPLIVKSEPGRVLAPVTDKRPAIASAATAFKAIKLENMLA